MYAHEDELIQQGIKQVNERIEGAMAIDDVRLSPFKNFPYVSIDLRGVRFYETKDQNARPLYTFSDVYLGFDIKAALRGHYDIKRIHLRERKRGRGD